MSEITWNDLTTEEQDMVAEMATRDRISDPDCDWSQDMYDGLVAKGVIINSDDEYTFTPAGRALLPAGEAVDEVETRNSVLFGKYQAYLEDMESLDLSDNAMNYQRWLEVEVIERDESNKMELTTLTASWESLNNRLTDELAAALARAQAAEEEAARLRVLFTEAVGREEELRDVLAAIRDIVASIQTNMHGMYIEQVDREKIVGGLENVHKVVHKALN